MKPLLSSYLAISAVALMTPTAINAAALSVTDTLAGDNIPFTSSNFEGGLVLEGTLERQGLNNPQTDAIPEPDTADVPIDHTFSASSITAAPVPSGGVISAPEFGKSAVLGVSDISTLTHPPRSPGEYLTGVDHLTDAFGSSLDHVVIPDSAEVTQAAGESSISKNGKMTGSITPDIDAPALAFLAFFGIALLGFGFLGYRRRPR